MKRVPVQAVSCHHDAKTGATHHLLTYKARLEASVRAPVCTETRCVSLGHFPANRLAIFAGEAGCRLGCVSPSAGRGAHIGSRTGTKGPYSHCDAVCKFFGRCCLSATPKPKHGCYGYGALTDWSLWLANTRTEDPGSGTVRFCR